MSCQYVTVESRDEFRIGPLSLMISATFQITVQRSHPLPWSHWPTVWRWESTQPWPSLRLFYLFISTFTLLAISFHVYKQEQHQESLQRNTVCGYTHFNSLGLSLSLAALISSFSDCGCLEQLLSSSDCLQTQMTTVMCNWNYQCCYSLHVQL